jgi:oligoribonuclease (3'-5' exoribonuclease)
MRLTVSQVIITDKELEPVDEGIERIVHVEKSILDKCVHQLDSC